MYIKWKLLLSFGTVFWILLCLYDIYFIDPATKFYYTDSDDYGWLAAVSEDEFDNEPIMTNNLDDVAFANDKHSFGECLLFWNVVIFLATVAFCICSKLASNHLWPNNKTKEVFPTEISKKCSGSKIPVLSTVSKSFINFCGTPDYTDFRSNTQLSMTSSTGDTISKHMEKECAKLRDDMISIQTTSVKEHALISKKLEMAMREKRELCKKLAAINKESATARQQVEQLLSEKCALLERLECATKEFKQNTKSKKAALAKLEESQAKVAILMKEVERYRNEKNDLETKFRKLDLENQHLKECVNYYEIGQRPMAEVKITPEKESNYHDFQENIVTKNEDDLSQSHKDVQRVQKRLIDLEKSLHKLKYTSWNKHDLKSKSETLTQPHLLHTSVDLTIPTIPESPLEMSHKKRTIRTDNLTDEQLQKIMIPPGDYTTEPRPLRNPEECLCSTLEYRDEEVPTKQFEVSQLKQSVLQNENDDDDDDDDDSSDDCDTQNRLISDSPQFQRFLHKMDKIDKLHEKLNNLTHML